MSTSRTAVLAIAFILAGSASIQAQVVTDKYPKVPKKPGEKPDKDAVLNTSALRLQVTSGATPGATYVPVVVACTHDSTVLYWWTDGAWRNLIVAWGTVSGIERTPKDLDLTEDKFGRLSWTYDIGLSATPNILYLSLRRSGQLPILRFKWNPTTKNLEAMGVASYPPNAAGRRSASTLWTCIYNDRLYLLSQQCRPDTANPGAEIPELILQWVTLSPQTQTPNIPVTAWAPPLVLATGGYEADALLEPSGKLHVVHRPTPYGIEADLPPEHPGKWIRSADLALASPPPLQRVEINLNGQPTLTIDAVESLPGGMHPQIHSGPPFLVTVDRVLEGRVTVNPFPLPGSPLPSLFPKHTSVKVRLNKFCKSILRKTNSGWTEAKGFEWSGDRVPGHLLPLGADAPLVDASLTPSARVRVTVALPWYPLYLIQRATNQSSSTEQLVFLSRRPSLDALAVTWYQVSATPPPSEVATLLGHTLLDLNHASITQPQVLASPYDNLQFSPAETDRVADRATSLSLVVDSAARRDVDAGIGGALSVAGPGAAGYTFYAYTDLGDGGLRVMCDDGAKLLGPFPPTPDGYSPQTVTGPHSPRLQWIDVTQPPDPGDAGLKSYLAVGSTSLVTAADAPIDFGWYMVDALSALEGLITGSTLRLDWEACRAIQSQYHEAGWSMTSEYEQTTNGLTAKVKVGPGKPFLNLPITFDAGDSGPNASTYDWLFEPETVWLENGPSTLSHTFPVYAPGPNPLQPGESLMNPRVTVRVHSTDGRTTELTFRVEMQNGLWYSLWHPLEKLESGWASLRDVTFDFSKYRVVFNHDADGYPKDVSVTTLPTYALRFRCLGNPSGQGVVEATLPGSVEVKDIELHSLLAPFVGIESVKADFEVKTSYTPGILRRDLGHTSFGSPDWTTDSMVDETSGLSLKPVTLPVATVTQVTVDWSPGTIATLIAAIAGAIGGGIGIITGLVTGFTKKVFGAIGGLFSWKGPATLLLSGVAVFTPSTAIVIMIAAVQLAVQDEIRSHLEKGLKDARITEFTRHAGQGVAEAIAVRTIEAAQGAEPAPDGLRRLNDLNKKEYWQTLQVVDGGWRMLIRKP